MMWGRRDGDECAYYGTLAHVARMISISATGGRFPVLLRQMFIGALRWHNLYFMLHTALAITFNHGSDAVILPN